MEETTDSGNGCQQQDFTVLDDGIEDLEGVRFKKLVNKLHNAQEKFKCVPNIVMRSSASTPQFATTGIVTRRNSRLIEPAQENYYLEAHLSPEKTV